MSAAGKILGPSIRAALVGGGVVMIGLAIAALFGLWNVFELIGGAAARLWRAFS